jgi:hypothetical protein
LRKYNKTAPKLRLRTASQRLKLKNSVGAKSEKNITEVFINLPITSKGKAGREKKVSISKKP